MRRRPWHNLVRLILATALALAGLGCGRADNRAVPAQMAMATDPLPQGALAVARIYMAARVAQDYKQVYDLLSVRSRSAYSLTQLNRFFENYVAFDYGRLGDVELQEEPEWVRVPIDFVRWEIKGQPLLTAERWYVTVHYDQGRWGVSLSPPLIREAAAQREQGNLQAVHRLADQMLAIDPWEFRGFMEKAYAYMIGNEVAPAIAALERAYNLAPPEMQPEVLRVFGNLAVAVGDSAAAAEAYTQALDGIGQHSDWYESSTEAAIRLNLAEALMRLDERSQAVEQALTAQMLYPFSLRTHALLSRLLVD